MAMVSEDLSWMSKISRHFPSAAALKKGIRGVSYNTDTREWPAYELADVMEQGLAQELSTNFTEASRNTKIRELTISRSKDRKEHVLYGEDETPCLIARKRQDGRGIDLYVASDSGSAPCALGPAFNLMHSQDTMTWELQTQSMRCAACAYRSPSVRVEDGHRTMLRVQQERVEIGSGRAMCMEVSMPEEGQVWCSCCKGTGSRGTELGSPLPCPSQEGAIYLASRRPRWSPRLKSLTLEFRGRCNAASAKNFQLAVGEGAADATSQDVVFLFGKMGPDLFCLDFAAPLGTVQAFALALTTANWK